MMKEYGVVPPRILLPRSGMEQWAVVACDQFTSEPQYWEACDKFVGKAPSTLRMILPEAYLEAADVEERIEAVKNTMELYLKQDIFRELEPGFVLVRRQSSDGERIGLVVAIDLEQYEYTKGSKSLIRPTEGTIEERIPPRLRIREGAALELPHIMILVDDREETLIEPLLKEALPQVYDFELMQGGGRIQGSFVGEQYFPQIESALKKLTEKGGMLFAVGDGNHSLATAKAYWEQLKPGLTAEQRETHPARFALVELVNLHCGGIVFHPIHRIVFDDKNGLLHIRDILKRQGGGAERVYCDSFETAKRIARETEGQQAIVFCEYGKYGVLKMEPLHMLSYGTLQPALELLAEESTAKVDYIHGDESLKELSRNGIGFFMPSMEKKVLFPSVEKYGALPKKTFSMGEAQDKRYYLESKRISL